MKKSFFQFFSCTPQLTAYKSIHPMKNVSIRIPIDLFARLEALKAAHGISVTSLIRQAVAAGLTQVEAVLANLPTNQPNKKNP